MGRWCPGVDTTLKPSEFCTNCSYCYNSSEDVEVWKCDGHENQYFEEQRSGYWYTQVKEQPRDIICRFYNAKDELIHEQVHNQAKRHRTLPNRLQHLWPEVDRRVTVDKATNEILDDRSRKAQKGSDFEEYDRIEMEIQGCDRYPGVHESGLNPSSISKIEYLDLRSNQLIYKLTDHSIIALFIRSKRFTDSRWYDSSICRPFRT